MTSFATLLDIPLVTSSFVTLWGQLDIRMHPRALSSIFLFARLGIVGQLPGVQGSVPIGMKAALKDSNMTDNKKGTAWMDALDPNFGRVADEWMKVLVEDFGTDHW